MAERTKLNPAYLIKTEEALRGQFSDTHEIALKKCLDHIDEHARAFIERSPFVCIGTQSDTGSADVSPRGDPIGFVQILDERTLLIPDRPGNNRLDTLSNIISNPQVGLLFLVPGFDETMRINGTAELTQDPALLSLMAVYGRNPLLAIAVHVAGLWVTSPPDMIDAITFTAPTAFRAIRKEDPEGEFIGKYDLSGFRTLFLAGERADPDTIQWAEEKLAVPVIDHWWQTETSWVIAGNPVGLGLLPVKHGSPAVAMPGYDVQVLDDEGHELDANTLGNIVVKLPLPPGCLPTLWNAEERFRDAYLSEFPGYYKTADAGFMDEDGYLFIMARTDDIINVAGHRLSTGGMEEVVASHKDVAECAVIGIADKLKGQIPAGFLILNAGVDRDHEEIEREVVQLVRDKIGPVAAFKTVMTVERLPKTRSGKILRGTMQKIADGQDWKMPATIDDPAILDEIGEALEKKGFAGKG